MKATYERENSKLNTVFSGDGKIARFLRSDLFIWLVAALTLLFWALEAQLAGIIVIAAVSCAALIFCRDASPAMASFTFIFFVFSDPDLSFDGKELWLLVLILPAVGFIVNLVRFGVKFEFKGYSFAMLICLLPWLLQGVTRSGRDAVEALLCAGIGIAFCAVYFLFNITCRIKRGEGAEYAAKILLALGVLISIQVLIAYIRRGDIRFEYDYIDLGWGSRNPVAVLLALCMPVSFYFATKENKCSFLFLFLGFAEFLLVLILRSRGVAVFAILALPVSCILAIVKAKHKVLNGAIIAAVVVVGVVTAICKTELIKNLFDRFASSGLNGLGRSELFAAGWDTFSKFPLFGSGFDYKVDLFYEIVQTSFGGPVYYHSTVVQIFACFGVLGAVTYFYLYYWRYRVICTNLSAVKFALLIGMLVFECYCFIDTVYFQPMGYFVMMVITLLAEKDLEVNQALPNLFRLKPRLKKS